MIFRLPLILLLMASSLGCASLAVGGGQTQVKMVAEKPGGRGLFLVSPSDNYQDCAVVVATATGQARLDCNTQFLVGCDASVPDSQSFCWLMQEVGPVRESTFPKARK